MYAARPARSVLSRCLPQPASSTSTMASCRSFQTTACQMKAKGRSRFRNLKAEQMGLVSSPKKLENYQQKVFPAYTEADKEALRQKYTPEQYEAIMAGEEAIDPKDLVIQGRLRDDPYKMDYLEDFATIQPVIDQKPKVPVAPQDFDFPEAKEWVDQAMDKLADHASAKMKDTIGEAVARALRRAKQDNPEMIDYTEEELVELEKNPELRRKLIVDGEAATDKMYEAVEAAYKQNPSAQGESVEWWDKIDKHFFEELDQQLGSDAQNPLEHTHTELLRSARGDAATTPSALAPELGKVPGVEGMYKEPSTPQEEALDPDGSYRPISTATGLELPDILNIMTKVVVVRRVSQQTRLGKVIRFHVMVVSGNGNGRLGLGEAKSTDPTISRRTATLLSLRNMKPVRRYEGRTIYGQMEKKVSGTVVSMAARPPGFGLRVSHRIFEMARLCGIHDLAAKVTRSRNPMNTVRATYDMLMNQPDPEQIAIGRGKKMVDVRKVYFGGSVY